MNFLLINKTLALVKIKKTMSKIIYIVISANKNIYEKNRKLLRCSNNFKVIIIKIRY